MKARVELVYNPRLSVTLLIVWVGYQIVYREELDGVIDKGTANKLSKRYKKLYST